MKGYRHPVWMQVIGWSVVIVMGWMSIYSIQQWIQKLWQ
jgi:Mn2+/Fe2+ NRAMP family transporter